MAPHLVQVHSGFEDVSRRAADVFVALASLAVKRGGRFVVALSGGATPKRLYELLADDEFRVKVDWSRGEVFWSDERCVPPESGQSNFALAHEAFLRHVSANVHRARGESNPVEAALAYEDEIRKTFGAAQGVPVFDLILLGVGTDGHTASLFPGSPALDEPERLVVEVMDREPGRVTFTLPLINHARHVAFIAAGPEKAGVIRHILKEGNARGYPAGRVRPVRGEVIWLLDREAAAEL